MSSNVLTPEEEEIIREQSKRCSLDTKQLLAIIQRLVKLLVEPRDNQPRYFTTTGKHSECDPEQGCGVQSIFSLDAMSEIRRVAREVAREEIQKYKVLPEGWNHDEHCAKTQSLLDSATNVTIMPGAYMFLDCTCREKERA